METPGSELPLKDDHFYTLSYSNQQSIGATARAAVSNRLEDVLQDVRCVRGFEIVMRLVSDGVLVVDVDARRDSRQLTQAFKDLAG